MFRSKAIQFHPLLLLLLIGSYFLGLFIELVAFFVIIMIHELGHYSAAKYFKWNITRLMIWPFGGVMETEDYYNRSSKEEFWVVMAGPLQHLWIFIVLLLLDYLSVEHIILDQLWMINTIILLFNLIPILPLDGGRIAFLILAKFKSFHQTIIAMSMASIVLIATINISLYFWGWTSIHLTFLSVFLVLDNWLLYKNKHILLLKHLLGRYLSNRTEQPGIEVIKAREQTSISEVVKHFKRDCYHFILIDPSNRPIPEEECLKSLFTMNEPNLSIQHIHAKEA